MKIELPENVKKIIDELNANGAEAYAVGGCVRDSILGRIPNDWDITTSAKPEEVKRIFRRTVDTGLKHGTVTVLMGKESFEVTTYRIDGEYEDGRHPKNVEFTSNLKEDLLRRDFTINAMAYNETEGLVDIFGGMDDIEKKVIRCVGNPEERFTEDALRLLRAIRFAAQLGYTIEDKTYEAIVKLAPSLKKISAERIQAELNKTLVSDNPAMLKTAYETGLTAQFIPELDICFKTEQNNPHHCYSVGDHIIKTIENIEKDKTLRLAMLFHDMAKPLCKTTDEDGIDHFHGHPVKSAEMSGEILRRLKYDNDTIDKVFKLVKYHDIRLEKGEKTMRRAMNNIGTDVFPDIFKVWKADYEAQSDYQRAEKVKRFEDNLADYESIIAKNECVCLKDLAVTGRDIIDLGINPGPKIGDILKEMLDEVIENPENNRKDYLLDKFVRENR
ncbi:MAG: HD domain-containing protein [Lachnospiraceae bacterium]|nr:HD domain-containing protein [Lachnospiraceae bacterium]